jgi:hypothetical protein
MAPELHMKIQSIKQQWDRVLALLAAAIGALSLVFGWVGVSGVSLVTQQIPYLVSGAAVGLVAFGVASTLWISADLRDEWAKLDDIYRAVTDQPRVENGPAEDAAAVEDPGAIDPTQERSPLTTTAPKSPRSRN